MARNSKVGKRIHRILDGSHRLVTVMNWSGWLVLLAIAAPLVYAAAAVQAVPRTPPPGPALQGAIVMAPPDDIASLEAKVSANPEDTASRVKLIGLYSAAGNREGRFTQLMWMIEHHPESALHQTYPQFVPPGRAPAEPMEDYEKICEAWSKQAHLHPSEPDVLINAADGLRWAYPETSENVLKRALEINPANSAARQRLGYLYSQLIESANGARYPSIQNKPEMAKRIQEELLASTNAALVGQVGATLANSPVAPSVNELGKRLIERANALDPSRSSTPGGSPSQQPPTRIRVGGNVQASKLIRKVDPEYPPLARQARIQGTVRFTAIIGRDGKIANLQLVSGHPLLVSAAQEAARQYEYQPTLLNGQPVEVVTQVDVNFTLGTEAPQASADSPTRIRVGGGVQAAKLINKVDPEYPPLAKQARIQGTVRFTATIGKDGNVEKVELVSGHPLLVQAATNAVKQYKYQPTFLNGQPVELTTYVDVNFQLP